MWSHTSTFTSRAVPDEHVFGHTPIWPWCDQHSNRALLAAAVEGSGQLGELPTRRRGHLEPAGPVRLRPIEREGPSACMHLARVMHQLRTLRACGPHTHLLLAPEVLNPSSIPPGHALCRARHEHVHAWHASHCRIMHLLTDSLVSSCAQELVPLVSGEEARRAQGEGA